MTLSMEGRAFGVLLYAHESGFKSGLDGERRVAALQARVHQLPPPLAAPLPLSPPTVPWTRLRAPCSESALRPVMSSRRTTPKLNTSHRSLT